MRTSVKIVPLEQVRADLLVIASGQLHDKVPDSLLGLDEAAGGALRRVVASGDFTGDRDQNTMVYPARGPRRVLLLGLSYKANVDDDRESPTYVLMDLLKKRGADAAYYDPYVPVIRPTREHPHWAGTKSVDWNRETVGGFDAVIIATNHQCMNYEELAEWSPCIVDTRNAMAIVKTKPRQVWKA